MKFIQRLFGRRDRRQRRTRPGTSIYARRAVFEQLEDRSLLSVSLSLDGLQMPVGATNVNVSQQAMERVELGLSTATVQSEISLTVNPVNPLNIVGATHRETDNPLTRQQIVDVFHSHDGGSTWFLTSIDYLHDQHLTGTNATYPGIRYDPAVTFDALGNLYLAYSWAYAGNSILIVARSFDGGQTFESDDFKKVAQDTLGTTVFHQARLATGIDPSNNNVPALYVAWTQYAQIGPNTFTVIKVSGSNELG